MTSGVTVLIPARLSSTRLPNKALADIHGAPMVVRVAGRAAAAGADRVVVATDHEAIAKACAVHGIESVMTSNQHESGTERLAEAADLLALADDTLIVNVQGDEPLIAPDLIRAVAAVLQKNPEAMATAVHRLHDFTDFTDPNCVKTVLDKAGNALYFSRAPIPWPRDLMKSGAEVLPESAAVYRHIGIYGYRADFLRRYARQTPSPLETVEMLEQLRVLWHGGKIKTALAEQAPAAGVDTEADLARVRAAWPQQCEAS